jgi:hypothetical protein
MEAMTPISGVLLKVMIDMPNVTYNFQTMELLKALPYKGHIVYMDRFNTLYKIIQEAKILKQYWNL